MADFLRREFIAGLGSATLINPVLTTGACHLTNPNSIERQFIDGDWYTPSSAGMPWSITHTPLVPSWRFEIRGRRTGCPFGDEAAADVGRTERYNRSELLGGYDQMSAGAIYEIQFYRRVSVRRGPSKRRTAIFGQIHRAAAGKLLNAYPTLALLLDANGERERVFVSGSNARPFRGADVRSLVKTIGPFMWDEWRHYRIAIRPDPAEGLVQIWLDGELVFSVSDLPVDYVSDHGPYFQFGIYARADAYDGSIAEDDLVAEYSEITGPRRLL